MSNRSTANASINQKQISARKTKSNGFECWQINFHRCKAAGYNLCEVTKNIRSGIVLIQEPWTYVGAIRNKLRRWKLFQGNKKDKRPRACIYVTSDMTCFLIPQFASEDVVAVRVKNVRREGDSFVFVSANMASSNSERAAVILNSERAAAGRTSSTSNSERAAVIQRQR